MKKGYISLMLALLMTASLTTSAFASNVEPSNGELPSQALAYNLDDLDLTAPFSEIEEYTTPGGEVVTVGVSFTPAPQTRGSGTYQATVGKWSTWMSYGVFYMAFDFDLSHSGSWRISNARNLVINCALMTVKEKSLQIGRASSTSTLPATVAANALCSVFDNQWVHLWDVTYILSVEVYNDGTIITHW